MNTPETPIYLDYAATTPTDPEVAAAMLPHLSGPLSLGNASSIHRFGRQARAAVDEARDAVARLIQADYAELYFTGSGTEADNLALIGAMQSAPAGRDHLVVSAIEHHAVLHTAHYLQTQGYAVTTVPCNSEGLVSPEAVAEAITDRTALVSIMHANNEIGTLQPIADFARIAHARGAKFHTDAVQSAGMLPVDVKALDCDLLSLCAHKIYGPKGAGALYIRQGMKISPQLHGGAQEREKRAGTENVAALVGFGKAAELSSTRRDADSAHLIEMRDLFLTLLRADIPDLILNGHPTLRLPNNVNVSVPGAEGTTLLMNLDRKGVAASSGSACSSGSLEPSHVLKAIGLADTLASSGVRFSLGRTTTDTELVQTAEIFAAIVHRLRRPR
ncbi:MAG: Cysteine sulfinate desulfinase/cysteine desulfurase [Chthonomonadaceae bacterium]|nr:Cysteine sulfinate desulfinase/cysteine desulfurase [Chthonomonadaceae bacterium]